MIIGIDLGTTNSLVAYYTHDGAKIIPNRLGKNLTPSVVSIDDNGQIYVGEIAKERMISHPDKTTGVFKRNMGTEKKFNLGDKEFFAEELSSFILRSLKEDAEEFLNEKITEAVISVPAYFNDAQRRATKKAGELAGLVVQRIVNEPTAAAIAYGLYQKDASTSFLVFDLGGGTFDVSILELYKNIMEVRAVAGDNYLGGEDFTDVLFRMFVSDKDLDIDALDEKTISHIKKQAELAKIAFSDNKHVTMSCKVNDEILEYKISIDSYESCCELLFAKIKNPIKRSLNDAGIKLNEIDEIVLVGGATMSPIVRKFVSKLFGRIPNCNLNPNEVVALGAALQGAMKERNEAVKEIVLTDVCPFTLGTEIVVGRNEHYTESGHFLPIIERNTVIPVSRTEKLYAAHDYQTKIRVQVLQGESRFAKNNLYLGELVINIPSKKAGEEAVLVTYTYDINSILEVEVKVASTGVTKKIIIKKEDSDLTDEEIQARFEELSHIKIHPRDQEENKLILARGERMYEESIGYVRQEIEYCLREFEVVLNRQDKHEIGKARIELKEKLNTISNEFSE